MVVIGTPEPISGQWPPAARMSASPTPAGPAAADGPPMDADAAGHGLASPSIPAMLADTAADLVGIARAEVLLGRAETRGNARTLLRSGIGLGAGLLFISLAAIFGTVALVVALAAAIGLLWALLSVTGLCLLLGVIAIIAARTGFARVRLLPEASLTRVSHDLEKLSERANNRGRRAGLSTEEQGHHA
jgi:hypothetical protein